MAAAPDGHARLPDCLQAVDIDSCGGEEGIAERVAELVVVLLQDLPVIDAKDLSDEGEAVGVDAGGGDADEGVAGADVLSRDHVLPVHDADGEACKVILLLRHKAGVFCGLAAKKRRVRLHAAFRNALYDCSDLLREVPAAGDVVQEKQRVAACTCDIVHAHGDAVDADRVVAIQEKCQLDLRADAVGAGEQDRILHILDLCQRECTGEAADAAEDLLPHRSLHVLLHELH